MIAITLWQPHATLIAWGLKPYETRDFTPRWKGRPYRGEIAIHAGTNTTDLESLTARTRQLKALGQWPPTEDGFLKTFHMAVNLYLDHHKIDDFRYSDFPLGAVVATARLHAVYDAAQLHPKLKWPDCDFGDFGQGRYAWALTDVKALKEPVPVRGQKGLWEWAQ